MLFISNFIITIYGIKSYDHHFRSNISSFQYQSRLSPRMYLNAEGIQLFITCLLSQANPAKLKSCELSHMVCIKHGDLKFISTLQNKSQCQSTVCAKFSIRKKVECRITGLTLLGFSISQAQGKSLQSACSKRETNSIKVPKENFLT